MERKPAEGLGTIRTASDLERKKLEVELKATEEIAKIKQSLIEKRLELELASLQDDYNPNVRTLQHSTQNEMENFENSTENKTNLREVEQFSLRYKNLLQEPPAPPPSVQVIRPFEPFLSPPNLPSNTPEARHFRPEPPENLQRNVNLPEKGRFMQPIQKPKYPAPSPMGSNPFKPQTPVSKYLAVPQVPVAETYYSNMVADGNPNPQQAPEEPGCSVKWTGGSRALSMWRTMMSKVRKKFRREPPAW